MKINLSGKPGNLSLNRALDILSNNIGIEELTEEEQKSIQQEEGNPVIVLDANADYEITETLVIEIPVCIKGNGARILNRAKIGFQITASNVVMENLTISEGMISVIIDALGRDISNICFNSCQFDRYILAGVKVGSTKNNSICRAVKFQNCNFRAQLSKNDKGEMFVCACDLILTAANSSSEDVCDAVLDGVTVEHCEVLGPSICNFMIVPGLSIDSSYTPVFDRCGIRNIKIADSKLMGSDDTAVAAQANYINNYNCYFENLEVINNICEFGLTGISASAGSPMKGDCDGIYIRNIHILNNVLTGKPDVGETRTAIGAGGGGINYYSCSCYNSWVQNMEIRGNKISDCERGITLMGGSSMIDADASSELKGNYVEDVIIEDNILKNVENCFIFYGAWIEGRRFDWNWGKHHTTQTWLPHVIDNSRTTMMASDNYIRKLRCVNNRCDGFSYLLRAAGAVGRGHGVMGNNRMTDDIIFRNNTFKNGENHIYVADCALEDWVQDMGGNTVNKSLKNI